MAIVIVVVGLLVGGGLTAISPVIDSSRITETKQKMATIESAILGYVITNGCLPCPADTLQASTAATAGRSNGTTHYTSGCAGPCDATVVGAGIVPWVTLGLSEDAVTDGWGRRMRFAIAPSRAAAATYAGGMVRSTSSSPQFPADASIDIENTAGTAQITDNVAYVIVSHGRDGSFGEAAGSGSAQASKFGQTTGSNGQGENDGTDLIFASGSPSPAQDTGYFDDFVVYRTIGQLILSCGTGTCGNPS